MAWELLKDLIAADLSDTPAAGFLALTGLSCKRSDVYYCAGGFILAHHPTPNIPPLYFDDGGEELRHRVILDAEAPVVAGTVADGNGNGAVNILAVDHYSPTDIDKMYTAGFTGAPGFGPIETISFAIPGSQVIQQSAGIPTPPAPFTIQLTNLLSDGGSSNLQVSVDGHATQIDGLTQQPLAGYGGFLMNDPLGNNKVSRIRIFRFIPGGDLTAVAGTGFAEVTDGPPHVHIDAPVVTLGETPADWQWQVHDGVSAVPAAIAGASGTKTTGEEPISALEYDIPIGLQNNRQLRFSIRIGDGSVLFPALGYLAGNSNIGDGGTFTPAFYPDPIVPDDALIRSQWDAKAGQIVHLAFLGNSHSWHMKDLVQPFCDTLWPGHVICYPAGNPGATFGNWDPAQEIVDGQPTFSLLPGEDTRNNYNGLLHKMNTVIQHGQIGLVNFELGTNVPIPQGSFLTDPFTLLSHIAADYANFNGPGRTIGVALQDIPYRFNQGNGVQRLTYLPLEAALEQIRSLFSGGHIYRGTSEIRTWCMNHRDMMQEDGIHLIDTAGYEVLMRFWFYWIAKAISQIWDASGSTGGAGSLFNSGGLIR